MPDSFQAAHARHKQGRREAAAFWLFIPCILRTSGAAFAGAKQNRQTLVGAGESEDQPVAVLYPTAGGEDEGVGAGVGRAPGKDQEAARDDTVGYAIPMPGSILVDVQWRVIVRSNRGNGAVVAVSAAQRVGVERAVGIHHRDVEPESAREIALRDDAAFAD